MLKALLECGADIDSREWVGPSGTLCRHSDRNLVRYYQGYSPLLISCYKKQKEIVKLLLSRKCNLDIVYEANNAENDQFRKYDALHAAARGISNQEIIDILMNEKKNWKYDLLTREYSDRDMFDYITAKLALMGEQN